jgi:ribosomal protein L20
MQLYKGFLSNDIDFNNEIVIANNHLLKKDYANYINNIRQSFNIISDKLKNNSYMCMYFHDSSLKFWNDLFEIMNAAGLNFITAIHIEKTQKTLKKILNPKKTMNGESLLFFKKEKTKVIKNNKYDSKNREELKKKLINLYSHKKRVSTSEIFDNVLLSYLVNNNLINSASRQYKDFVDIIQEILDWDEKVGQWIVN